MVKTRNVNIFVKLDSYESSALRRLQRDMEEAGGKKLSMEELIRGFIRLYVHETMGQDYMLGPDIRQMMKDAGLSRDVS